MSTKKPTPQYTDEFKKTIVNLYHSGKSYSQLHNEYGISSSALSNWVHRFSEVKIDENTVFTAQQIKELQKELLKLANSKADYTEVADEIDRLRELKQDALVEAAERDGFKLRIAEMMEYLKEQDGDIEKFDETLVRKMIEKVMVYEDMFTVEFKAGISLDIAR